MSTIFLYAGLTFAFLVIITIGGMVIVHITEIHEKLHFTNEENIKLLNGMHEGVLILRHEPGVQNDVMFCNLPALKLVNKFLGKLRKNGTSNGSVGSNSTV